MRSRGLLTVVAIGVIALLAPRLVRAALQCGSRVETGLASALVSTGPEDPVVEEPIRPLRPSEDSITPPGAARCGTVDIASLFGGASLLAPRFVRRRRFKR